jgi:hypothetical protein
MTLPYADDVKSELSEEEKNAARVKLLITIMPVEGVAVLIVYIIPVGFLGWDFMTMAIPLIGVMLVCGLYYVIGLRNIDKR